MVEVLGPLPEAWDRKWHFKNLYMDRNESSPRQSLMSRIRGIQADMLHKMGESVESPSDEDVDGSYELLSMCLRYSPSDSPTMNEVIELPWMKRLLNEQGFSAPLDD